MRDCSDASIFCLLGHKAAFTIFVNKSLYKHMPHVLLGTFLRVEWLDNTLMGCLNSNKLRDCVPKCLQCFTFSAAVNEHSSSSTSSQKLEVCLYIVAILVWLKWYFSVVCFTFPQLLILSTSFLCAYLLSLHILCWSIFFQIFILGCCRSSSCILDRCPLLHMCLQVFSPNLWLPFHHHRFPLVSLPKINWQYSLLFTSSCSFCSVFFWFSWIFFMVPFYLFVGFEFSF